MAIGTATNTAITTGMTPTDLPEPPEVARTGAPPKDVLSGGWRFSMAPARAPADRPTARPVSPPPTRILAATVNTKPAPAPPQDPPRVSWLLRIEMLRTTITVLLIGALMLWFNAVDHGGPADSIAFPRADLSLHVHRRPSWKTRQSSGVGDNDSIT
jgi:hypothetical protein